MTKKIMLIFVSADGNNNKFYYVELTESGSVITKYGRVGTDGVQGIKNGGLREYEKIVRSKQKKGYVEVPIDLEADGTEVSQGGDIMMIALAQIDSDDRSKKLIETLVKKNIHNIINNTKITFNASTGLFKTPLGIVTKEGVDNAISLLDKLSNKPNSTEAKKLSEQYYSIIPTVIRSLRSPSALLDTDKKLSEQYDICNALLQSIDLVQTEKDKKVQEVKADTSLPDLFHTSLRTLDDQKEFDRINKYFEDSKNSQHGYTTSNAKIKSIYKISIDKDDKAYRDDMDNQMELWHGTKVANLLSILKSGLLMPKYSPGSVTGYMFGQGLYFAKQSSKSLNYCDGMYWNSSNRSDNTIYMFVADIAMGNYQVPQRSTSKHPDKGYDSYWAQPGKSGIRNDEMIVFKNEQIRLKYLLEIKLK